MALNSPKEVPLSLVEQILAADSEEAVEEYRFE